MRAAELHDIGKIAIPDAIIDKPGPLDDEEWRFMRRHTLIGEGMLSAAPALASVAKVVRSSHERFDGGAIPTRWPETRSRAPADRLRLRRLSRDDVGSPLRRRP